MYIMNIFIYKKTVQISPLQSSVTFLYPLKASETFRFSDVFKGHRRATAGGNGLSTLNRTKLNIRVIFPLLCNYDLAKNCHTQNKHKKETIKILKVFLACTEDF